MSEAKDAGARYRVPVVICSELSSISTGTALHEHEKECFPCSKPARAGADGNSPWGGRWLRAALCRAALRRCGPAAILRCAGRAHGGLPEHSSAPRQAAVRASKPWFLQQPARSAPPAPLNPGRQCGSPRCAQRCPPCEPRGHGAGRPRSAARNFRLETSV